MATPFGHSLAGFAVYTFAPSVNHDRLSLALLCIIMANAPDLDFLPGILAGSPASYHQGITHSVGFALLVSLGAAAVYRVWGQSFPLIFTIAFFAYLSHLAIDFFGPDGRLPYGEPLFWPISDRYFISPIPVFSGVHHVPSTYGSTQEWIRGILSAHNIRAIVLESVLILPFAMFGLWFRKRALTRAMHEPLGSGKQDTVSFRQGQSSTNRPLGSVRSKDRRRRNL
jgi:inner membrane protein